MLHKGCQDTINKGVLLDMYIFYTILGEGGGGQWFCKTPCT